MAERPGDAAPPEIERAKQVFRVLEAFAERNLPVQRHLADQPWSMILADLPPHPSIVIGEVQLSGGEIADSAADDANETGPLLVVVSDGQTQVAVECDGDRVHGFEQIPLDMARQAVLERAGWRFIRIRGTRFYRDPAATMAWVFEELGRLGVGRSGLAPGQQEVDEEARSFREKVVRRAREIMRERSWLPVDDDDRVNAT